MKNNTCIYGSLFVTGLIMSNVLASKIVTVFGLDMPSATFAYALTFLVTDVVGENYGKTEANKLVRDGFFCLVVSFIIIRIAILLPSNNDTHQFENIFNSSSRVICASIFAYLVSQFIDVFLFHKIKNFSNKYKWIRNNLSTIFSQLLDTVIFTLIGFYGRLDNHYIFEMILDVFLAKVILAIFDTPFFYLLTRQKNAQN